MSELNADQLEAIQNVVDRVGAYQDGAPERTVDRELREGLEEAGITLDDGQIEQLAEAIDAADGDVSAKNVLA